MKKAIVCLLALASLSASAGTLPEGATLRDKTQAKMLEFSAYHLIYDEENGLDEAQKQYIDQKCDAQDKVYTEKYLSNFQLGDLVVGKDVSFGRNLPSERFFVSIINPQDGEAYVGCKHYLKVSRTGYMATKLDLEFLNETSCELSIDKTKLWIDAKGDKSVISISGDTYTLSRREVRQRGLPRRTEACVVSLTKVEKVL